MSKKLVISTTILVALLLPFIIPASITLAAPNPFEKFDPSIQGDTNAALNSSDLLINTSTNTATSASTPATTNDSSLIGDVIDAGAYVFSNVLNAAAWVVIKPVFYLLNFIVSIIAKIFIWIAVALVKLSIDINHTIVKGDSLAHYGWGITLNLANLLIVISIVAIAFGTMFRQAWGIKLLPKLIIIAILINFSYFIATELVTIADNITVVFLDTINKAQKWDAFANFFTTDANFRWQGTSEALGALGSTAASLFGPVTAIAFTFIAFLTLLAVAVAFFIRYVILTILLILLPIALGLSLLPIKIGKVDAWQEWKDEFIKWLLFGPIMTFFIYLSFALLQYPPTTTTGFVNSLGSNLGNNIAVIGILLGGLVVANKLGIAGAGIIQAGVDKGLSTGKRYTARAGNRILGSDWGRDKTAAIQKSKIPGVKFIGRGLNVLGAKTEKLVKEDRFKDLSSKRTAAELSTLNGSDLVAPVSRLAKARDLNDIKDEAIFNKVFSKETKDSFGRADERFDEVEKVLGIPLEAYEALKVGDQKTANEATEKFYKEKMGKEDFSKQRISDLFDDTKKGVYGVSESMRIGMREASTFGLVNNLGFINKAAPGIKSIGSTNYIAKILELKLPEKDVSVEVNKKQVSMSKGNALKEFITTKDNNLKNALMNSFKKSLKESDHQFERSFSRMQSNKEFGAVTIDTSTQTTA